MILMCENARTVGFFALAQVRLALGGARGFDAETKVGSVRKKLRARWSGAPE